MGVTNEKRFNKGRIGTSFGNPRKNDANNKYRKGYT